MIAKLAGVANLALAAYAGVPVPEVKASGDGEQAAGSREAEMAKGRPAVPAVTRPHFERRWLPSNQCEPAVSTVRNMAQSLTGNIMKPQIVMQRQVDIRMVSPNSPQDTSVAKQQDCIAPQPFDLDLHVQQGHLSCSNRPAVNGTPFPN